MKILLFLAAFYFAATGTVLSQGSNQAFDLSANPDAKNHLDLGDLPLGEIDFTVEFWYKAGGAGGDPAIFSNKDWDSGTNTGINVAIQGGGSNMDINFKSAESDRVDLNVTTIDFGARWNFVSIIVERATEIKVYVNGVLQVTADISESIGTISSEHTFKFGQDGTGAYGNQALGQMDEFRIWSDIRTQEEIRAHMSTGLTGLEDDLLLYFNFDDGVDENELSLTGDYNATIVAYTADSREVSGAAIGDEVITAYPAVWDGEVYTLDGPSGVFTISDITGELAGIQFYKINEAPNSITGIHTIYENETYYGVYLIGAVGANYKLTYDYSIYDDALLNEENATISVRNDNAMLFWYDIEAAFDFVEDKAILNTSFTGEFILGFADAGEPAPSDDLFGAGMNLNFNGTSNWIDLSNGIVSAESLGLPAESITVEAWVKPRSFSTWRSVVSFLQDNGDFEKGWDIETRDGNKFAFSLSTEGNLTYLETENSFVENRWYHVTGTYDGITQKIYVNGQLEGETTVNSGPIDYADSWLAVGAYKDDNEEEHLNANIDEIRIWHTARTAEEIRDLMCEKADPTNEDLFAYYSLDEVSGTEVVDVSGHLSNGIMLEMGPERREESGAPIGDESVHLYDADWSSDELTLTTADNGEVTVKVHEENPYGVHIYYTNGTPITDAEFPLVEGTNGNFGIFIAESNEEQLSLYNYKWSYDGFDGAESGESELALLQRTSKFANNWSINDADVDMPSNNVLSDTIAYRTEMVLISNELIACTLPSDLGLVENTESSATVSWLNGGSTISNIQYGIVGFTLGEGTIIHNQTDEIELIEGVESSFLYALYVQDSCETSNSPWVGPFIFTAEKCEEPTAVLIDPISANEAGITWDGMNGTDWTFSWGLDGFDVDFGVMTLADEIPFTLGGLAPETAYQFYLRSNCSFDESRWVGPFDFTTTAVDHSGIDESELEVGVYPNPTTGELFVQSSVGISAYQIINVSGMTVLKGDANGKTALELSLNQFSTGVYYLQIIAGNKASTIKVLKK
ncbi:LamG-like jellyroll fold domain-containing protein [Crocinitomix catalasitica]|uniref:LamG-like jellyroll fold domain-containing protein n=1 Tax=Crocinitomix catalasitica TaxID=184607 RepID=UPI00048742AA|nr:LamG-like jellyroll fold domain-containing protein [Crocinitomix catalasitica]